MQIQSISDSPLHQKIQEYADQGLVTEEIISHDGVDDILVTKVNNPENHPCGAIVVETLMRMREEYGYSIFSETKAKRKHYGVQWNEHFTQRFDHAKPDAKRGGINVYFELRRPVDTIEEVKVKVPHGIIKMYDVFLDVVRVCSLVCHCRETVEEVIQSVARTVIADETEIGIKLDSRIELVSTPNWKYCLRVNVPAEMLPYWSRSEAQITQTGMVMDDDFRLRMCRQSGTPAHPTILCPISKTTTCALNCATDEVPDPVPRHGIDATMFNSGCTDM